MFHTSNLKQILAPLIFFTILINIGISQNKLSGGIGFFSTGYQNIDISNLNLELRNNNLPEFEKNFLAIGGGGFGVVKNFVLGGEGFGLISPEKNNKDFNLSLSGGYGLFNIGYIIYSSKGLNLFPLIGFGAGGIELKIAQRKIISFNEVLNNPKNGSNLSIAGLMFNFGMSLVYNIDLSQTNNSKGINLGLNLGYTHFLQVGDWTLFEEEIFNGPKIGISGLYIKFTIGGGAIGNKIE